MSPASTERDDKHGLKRYTAHEDCVRICFTFVFVCGVGKNSNTPKLSPMADDAITLGGISGLGSPLYKGQNTFFFTGLILKKKSPRQSVYGGYFGVYGGNLKYHGISS